MLLLQESFVLLSCEVEFKKKTGIIFMSLILLLNPQAVLAIDLLCDIIEKIHHS